MRFRLGRVRHNQERLVVSPERWDRIKTGASSSAGCGEVLPGAGVLVT